MLIRIYIGPSASGKDYFLNQDVKKGYERVVSYTTRPKRPGETDGIDYNFVDEDTFATMISSTKLLEYRLYKTSVNGKEENWYYGSPLLDINSSAVYVIVLDVAGAMDYIKAYGRENVEIIFVNTPADVRKQRAIKRGGFDETEWNRREADDAIKFSDSEIDELCRLCGGAITCIRNHFEDNTVIRYTRYAEEYDEILATELELMKKGR